MIYKDFKLWLTNNFDNTSNDDVLKAMSCFMKLEPKCQTIEGFKRFFKKKSLLLIDKAEEKVMRTYEFGLAMNEVVIEKIAKRNRYLVEG